jgi:hypothetical protein
MTNHMQLLISVTELSTEKRSETSFSIGSIVKIKESGSESVMKFDYSLSSIPTCRECSALTLGALVGANMAVAVRLHAATPLVHDGMTYHCGVAWRMHCM